MDDFSKKINKVIDLFKDDELYKACYVNDDLSEWRVFRKYSRKVLDTTWLETIEDCLMNLDSIVRNPRRFIIVEEELVDTSRARSVSEEAVKFLATHTNFIEGFDGDMILPSKLLNTIKEESYQVYENRFVYTLLRRLSSFVRTRYDALKGAASKNEQLELVVDKKLSLGVAQLSMRLDSIVKMPFEEALQLNKDDLGPIERLAKVYNIVMGFMATPFAKEMASSEPVRPPITRTNAILKNTNFKKALALWEFLQSYEADGYEVKSVLQTEEMSEDMKKQYRLIVFLNSAFMQNLTNEDFKVKATRTKVDEDVIEPNEYPTTDIGVEEIKTIAVPWFFENELKTVQKTQIIASIDRAIAQQHINDLELDSKKRLEKEFALRKAEKAYRDSLIKQRKAERKRLEKEAKATEKLKLKERTVEKKFELERQKEAKAKILEKKRKTVVNSQLERELIKLNMEATNRGLHTARSMQNFANKKLVVKETFKLNKLRKDFKQQLNSYVDEQIDSMISKLPKMFITKNKDEK